MGTSSTQHAPAATGIEIGGRQLETRFFLAPLAGYTHLAFRRVLRELGGVGQATTDLVQATHLLSGKRKSLELIATAPDDRPLSIQIFSGKTAELVKAARWLEQRGYEAVDLNMGCPMAKINGQGGGARLLCDTSGACDLVAQVVAAVEIPVTVKMRLGWDRHHIAAPALAREFEQLGVAAVTIHGRTRQQGFHGDVCLDGIAATVAAVDQMPIIGNGDVRNPEDAFRMRRVTGCDAVAIGRGAMLDPWIFRKLAQRSANLPVTEPSAADQIAFLRRHFELMCEQHADYSCILFRKFAAWYGAVLGIPEDLEDRLRRIESIAQFGHLTDEIEARHGQRRTRQATALIRTPNGPNERW